MLWIRRICRAFDSRQISGGNSSAVLPGYSLYCDFPWKVSFKMLNKPIIISSLRYFQYVLRQLMHKLEIVIILYACSMS